MSRQCKHPSGMQAPMANAACVLNIQNEGEAARRLLPRRRESMQQAVATTTGSDGRLRSQNLAETRVVDTPQC